MWANTPFTSGPGAVLTYSGSRAWPQGKPPQGNSAGGRTKAARNSARSAGSISNGRNHQRRQPGRPGRAGHAAGTAAGPAHPDGGIHPERQEYALVVEAARQAGMARRAYVATVVLDGAANGTTASGQDPLELILIELMRAAGLVRRITTNLNQAIVKLTATGQPA